MVIQRIQTVFLLIASVLMFVLSFAIPVAVIDKTDPQAVMYLADSPTLLILNCLIGVLLLVDIFLFKNLKLQMRVTMMCILLMIVSLGITAFILSCRMPLDAEVSCLIGAAVMLVAFICAVAAYNRMKADQKLLRSYNSLR